MRILTSVVAAMGVLASAVAAQVPPIYPASDARRDIAQALASAGKDGKHVLLDFGADWCPDCRVLDQLLKDAAVAPAVAANFHVVRIDVGRRDRNGDLADAYQATSGDWIPALVALDPTGTVIGVTDAEVRVTRRTTPAEMLTILTRWTPKHLVAAIGELEENGVHVRVALERDWQGHHWIAATFRPLRPEVHLYGMSLPLTGVDGLGRPTRLEVIPSPEWMAEGPTAADRVEQALRFDALDLALMVYPAGPVTLRAPVRVSRAGPVAVNVTYMGCSDLGCLPPVVGRRVPLHIGPDAPGRPNRRVP